MSGSENFVDPAADVEWKPIPNRLKGERGRMKKKEREKKEREREGEGMNEQVRNRVKK